MALWIWGRKYDFLHNMTGEKRLADYWQFNVNNKRDSFVISHS